MHAGVLTSVYTIFCTTSFSPGHSPPPADTGQGREAGRNHQRGAAPTQHVSPPLTKHQPKPKPKLRPARMHACSQVTMAAVTSFGLW